MAADTNPTKVYESMPLPPEPTPKRRKIKKSLLLLIIALIGGVVGATMTLVPIVRYGIDGLAKQAGYQSPVNVEESFAGSEITSIDVQDINYGSGVEFLPSPDDLIHVTYTKNEAFGNAISSTRIDTGLTFTNSINTESLSDLVKLPDIFSAIMMSNDAYYNPGIKILLPDGWTGDIIVGTNDVTMDDVIIDGDLTILDKVNRVWLNKVHLSGTLTVGDVMLEQFTEVYALEANLTSSDTYLYEMGSLYAPTINWTCDYIIDDIKLDGEQISLLCTAGPINVTLAGAKGDYTYSITYSDFTRRDPFTFSNALVSEPGDSAGYGYKSDEYYNAQNENGYDNSSGGYSDGTRYRDETTSLDEHQSFTEQGGEGPRIFSATSQSDNVSVRFTE